MQASDHHPLAGSPRTEPDPEPTPEEPPRRADRPTQMPHPRRTTAVRRA